jgi:hypothetical protein
MQYVRRRRELSDEAFEITVEDVLANDRYASSSHPEGRVAGEWFRSGGRTVCTDPRMV